MKNNFFIKIIILFISIFFFSHNIFAATLELSAEKNILQKNEAFILIVSLNTEGQSINTLEGDLNYDASLIEAESVNTDGSLLSFWVEKPDIKNPGLIHFSGIIPGGISVVKGEILKVIFKTQKKGDASLTLNNVNMFLNDGYGTSILTKVKNINIKIVQPQNLLLVIFLIVFCLGIYFYRKYTKR